MFDPLNHLSGLRVFEAVARLGSIRQAALELGVTDGAVSKQIKQLEATLQADLFHRGHRKLIPTDAAVQLASSLTTSFETVVRAVEQLHRGGSEDALVLAAPSTFLVRWLLPRLPRLLQRLRGTEVSVVTWEKDLATSDRSIDLYVTVGPDPETLGMVRHTIGPETFGPVVHPDLLRKPGESIDVLSTRRLTTSWPSAMWSNWSSESENPLPDAEVTRFEGLTFAIAAAEAGMGSVLAPGPSVWDALAEGKLVAPLGFHRREGDWALSWHSDQTSGVHLAALRWFEQEFSESAGRAGV